VNSILIIPTRPHTLDILIYVEKTFAASIVIRSDVGCRWCVKFGVSSEQPGSSSTNMDPAASFEWIRPVRDDACVQPAFMLTHHMEHRMSPTASQLTSCHPVALASCSAPSAVPFDHADQNAWQPTIHQLVVIVVIVYACFLTTQRRTSTIMYPLLGR